MNTVQETRASKRNRRNKIPDSWKVISFSEFAVVNPARSLEKGKNYPYLPMDVLSIDSKIHGKPERRIWKGSGGARFNTGDVLLARITPSAENGKTAIADLGLEHTGFGSTELIVLAPKQAVSTSHYIYYLLKDEHIRDWAISQMTGSTGRQRIPVEAFDAIQVFAPPYKDQQKITAILSSIDDALEASQAVLKQLQVTKQVLVKHLFGCGVGPASDSLQKTLVGYIPSHWEVANLNDVCDRVTDGVHQAVQTDDAGTVPFLYVSCIQPAKILWSNTGRITKELFEEITKGREPSEDVILFTAVGSYGNAVLLQDDSPLAFQRHIAYIAVDKTKAVPKFIECWLNSPFSRAYADRIAVGNAQKTVTLKELSNFPIPLPPMDEQKEIADFISTFDNRTECERDKKAQLQIVKQGLMQQLLTGKLRVMV